MRYLVFTIAVLLSVSSLLAQIAVDAQHWWAEREVDRVAFQVTSRGCVIGYSKLETRN